VTYRYESRWLYLQAQLADEWDDTPPEEGTSVRAGCEVLRTIGHRRVQAGGVGEPNLAHGITAYRWATGVDEIRAAIAYGLAVALGVNWYEAFDHPTKVDGEWWVGRGDLGRIRGGHCVCIFRHSDRRQAVQIMNSWGEGYPPVWVPYNVIEQLLDEYGEASVVTDR
jgi:hypothetical protein